MVIPTSLSVHVSAERDLEKTGIHGDTMFGQDVHHIINPSTVQLQSNDHIPI